MEEIEATKRKRALVFNIKRDVLVANKKTRRGQKLVIPAGEMPVTYKPLPVFGYRFEPKDGETGIRTRISVKRSSFELIISADRVL